MPFLLAQLPTNGAKIHKRPSSISGFVALAASTPLALGFELVTGWSLTTDFMHTWR